MVFVSRDGICRHGNALVVAGRFNAREYPRRTVRPAGILAHRWAIRWISYERGIGDCLGTSAARRTALGAARAFGRNRSGVDDRGRHSTDNYAKYVACAKRCAASSVAQYM